ncbi:Shugoshin [Citrus sinensis]|uniref:SHUGOSHIN 2 isoform X1 n=1 Tax=Citrus sinensis TaxID=2711 RepID=UPI0003D6DF2E|nr:SHUGOSHIN 2 isoform X1 [Citrus sinensis]KAH9660525.1 Shugoshin [Citrus sinensis]
MKGERMAKRSSFGSIMRRRLSDITNSQSRPKVLLSHEEKPSQVSPASGDLVDQLIKEKTTLMRFIEERNKIIELSSSELHNLRISIQKLQLQNWNLAQSNSQYLAEINLGREKVKALQHELVCKDALIKAKSIVKERKTYSNCENTASQDGEKVIEECVPKANENVKTCERNRRRSTRCKSMGPSTTRQKVAEKENVENKRRCVRRQSARFKSQERAPTENLFEIEDSKLPATQPLDDPMHEDNSIQAGSSTANEEFSSSRNEARLSHRSSMGRPSRKAAEKVQSYKELPLKVKMRKTST